MDTTEAPPPTKKARPHFPKKVKKACANCRRAHSRCDDKRPCSRCVAHLIPHTCDVDSSMVVRNTVSDPVVYAPSIQPTPHQAHPPIKRSDEESRKSDPRAISWWNVRNRDQLCLVQCSTKFSEDVLGCPSEVIVNRLLLHDLFVNKETVTLITTRLDYNIRFGPVEALWNTANGQTKTVLFWCNCKVLSFGTPFDLELGVFPISESSTATPMPAQTSTSNPTQNGSSSPPRSPQLRSPKSRSPPSRSPPSRSPPSRSPPRAAQSMTTPSQPQIPLQPQPILLYSRPPGSFTPQSGAPISLFSNPPNRHGGFNPFPPAATIQAPIALRAIPFPNNPSLSNNPATTPSPLNLPSSSSSSSQTGLSALSESAISEMASLKISHNKDQPPSSSSIQTQTTSTFTPLPNLISPFDLSSHSSSTSHNSSPDLPSTFAVKSEPVRHRSTIHNLLN